VTTEPKPITRVDGQVVDGHHREAACRSMGIEPVYRDGEQGPRVIDRPTPIERAITQYQQVLRARVLAHNAQHLLAAMLAVLTDKERGELNPEILAEAESAEE
jgi:hypothetical protein